MALSGFNPRARGGRPLFINAANAASRQWSRGVNNTNLISALIQLSPTAAFFTPACLFAYDVPNTSSSQTYAVQGHTNGNTLTYSGPVSLAGMEITI